MFMQNVTLVLIFIIMQITYELVGDSTDLFKIDPQSGDVTTKKELDREIEEFCFVKVIAKDGAPSAMLKNGEPNTGIHQWFLIIFHKIS